MDKKKKGTNLTVCAFGAPEGTRTPDLTVRSRSLYPAELLARVHLTWYSYSIAGTKGKCKRFFQIF